MAFFIRVALIYALVASFYLAVQQHQSSDGFLRPQPAKQLAYVMRLYHTQAIAYKTANPTVTGALTVPLPAFLTGGNFAFCANSTSVATYTTLSPTTEANQILVALETQDGGGYGIGISTGTSINTPHGLIPAACDIPAGAAVIQTQVVQ